MPGNYSKLVTVITGQTITAAERNNEFDNVINNMTPDGVDDASANTAAMQATADPSGGSLATTLRGELQRLRFQLLKLGSASGNWYDALPFLAGITPATAGATGTDLNNRIAQLASQIKNLGGLTNWYDAVTAALLKTGGTMTGELDIVRAAGNYQILLSDTGGANNEYFGFFKAASEWYFQSGKNGSGTARPVSIYIASFPAITVNTDLTLTTHGIVGTVTNDDAAAGSVGAYVSSSNSAGVNSPGTGQWYDVVSISLGAGDWDVTGIVGFNLAGATATQCAGGISVTSGNSGTGLTTGDNFLTTSVPNSVFDTFISIPGYRKSLSATTTIYLKARWTNSAGTPNSYGRLSARRVR